MTREKFITVAALSGAVYGFTGLISTAYIVSGLFNMCAFKECTINSNFNFANSTLPFLAWLGLTAVFWIIARNTRVNHADHSSHSLRDPKSISQALWLFSAFLVTTGLLTVVLQQADSNRAGFNLLLLDLLVTTGLCLLAGIYFHYVGKTPNQNDDSRK